MLTPELINNSDSVPMLKIEYVISNRDYDIAILNSDCETNIVDPFDMNIIEYHESQMTESLNVEVGLTLNEELIKDSEIWASTNAGGSFTFCLTTSLYADEEKNEVVRKKSAIFIVDVNNEAEFELSELGVTTVDPEVFNDIEIDLQVMIDAYQCDPKTLERYVVDPILGPFDVLNVCIEETSNKKYGLSITDFELTQVHQAHSIRFAAIVDDEIPEKFHDLVEKKCDEELCLVQIVLIDSFFDELIPIQVNGGVLVKSIRSSHRERGAFKDEAKSNSAFTMNVDLYKPCEEATVFGRIVKKMFET